MAETCFPVRGFYLNRREDSALPSIYLSTPSQCGPPPLPVTVPIGIAVAGKVKACTGWLQHCFTVSYSSMW